MNVTETFAILPPDNQTGDAAADWAVPLISRGLAAEVGVAVPADTIAEGRNSNANRVVYSTLTPADTAGELRLHSTVFNPDGQRFVKEFTVTGTAVQVINRMAGLLTAEPWPLGVKTDEALRKWPLPSGDFMAYEARCQELSASEPTFGPALAGCLEQLNASHRTDAMRDILSHVPAESSAAFPPRDRAVFGQAYMAVKDYTKSAVLFKASLPWVPEAENTLAYAQALGGQYETGVQTLEGYIQKVPEDKANALDSLGEISYFCGKYKEAAAYFLRSAPEWKPQQPQGQLEPLKAAAAQLMAGDEAGANRLVSDYVAKEAKKDQRVAVALDTEWKSIVSAPTPEGRKQRIGASLIRLP